MLLKCVLACGSVRQLVVQLMLLKCVLACGSVRQLAVQLNATQVCVSVRQLVVQLMLLKCNGIIIVLIHSISNHAILFLSSTVVSGFSPYQI